MTADCILHLSVSARACLHQTPSRLNREQRLHVGRQRPISGKTRRTPAETPGEDAHPKCARSSARLMVRRSVPRFRQPDMIVQGLGSRYGPPSGRAGHCLLTAAASHGHAHAGLNPARAQPPRPWWAADLRRETFATHTPDHQPEGAGPGECGFRTARAPLRAIQLLPPMPSMQQTGPTSRTGPQGTRPRTNAARGKANPAFRGNGQTCTFHLELLFSSSSPTGCR